MWEGIDLVGTWAWRRSSEYESEESNRTPMASTTASLGAGVVGLREGGRRGGLRRPSGVDATTRRTRLQVNAKKGKPFTANGVLSGARRTGASNPFPPASTASHALTRVADAGALQRTAPHI
jgi:hypothetical protein